MINTGHDCMFYFTCTLTCLLTKNDEGKVTTRSPFRAYCSSMNPYEGQSLTSANSQAFNSRLAISTDFAIHFLDHHTYHKHTQHLSYSHSSCRFNPTSPYNIAIDSSPRLCAISRVTLILVFSDRKRRLT